MAVLVAAYLGALAAATWARWLPGWTWWGWGVANLVTAGLYARDKHAARHGAWRTPEATLHLWSLAGGWVGAWLAQQVLRHKSRKGSFRAVYAVTVALHLAMLGAWLWWGPQLLALLR